MAIPLNQEDKTKLLGLVINYLLKPQIESINTVLQPILEQQKVLCLVPDNQPNRFTYRGKEYRDLTDTGSKWCKAYPLHKSLHHSMPLFLSMYEPFELQSARIRSVVIAAFAYSSNINDFKQLIPKDALTNVSVAPDPNNPLNRPQTLTDEEIKAFKDKQSEYLFAIEQSLFTNMLMEG